MWMVQVLCLGLVGTAIVRAQSYGALRLVRGSSFSSSYSSGRLEIYINGQWGTVCDDSWGLTDSNVACRQLGYSHATRYGTSRNLGFGSGTGRIWLDDVGCTGSELRLTSCRNNGIGSHNCGHSEDVAIYCTNSCTSSQWRCSNGQCISSYQRCNGVWQCADGSDEWNCTSCSGSSFQCNNRQCIRSFGRCNGTRDCSDGSDEVNCTSQSYGALRLVRGSSFSSSYSSGRLEIYINGQWGTVCDDSWGLTDSNVACQQLGYSRATRYGTSHNLGFGSGTGRIWLDDVGCIGSELRLTSCRNRGIGSHNCGHSEDVAIYCTNSCTSYQWRCRNGQCISSYQRCNGVRQCADGSDELDCSSCTSSGWRCPNGQCISSYQRCDGIRQCTDGSDELSVNCPPCASYQWRCPNGRCISSYQRCDGVRQCTDGSDELSVNCPPCASYQWRCPNGRCISSYQRCDGVRQCTDGSDELSVNCPPCTSYQWRCSNGQCISSYQRCNGVWQCADGSDEQNCISCTGSSFRCNNRQCIRSSGHCNGTRDCSDGSDEVNCTLSIIVGTTFGVLGLVTVLWCIAFCICMKVSTCPLHNIYYKRTIQNLAEAPPVQANPGAEMGGVTTLHPPPSQQTTF